MEISQELKDKVLSDFRLVETQMLESIQSKEWRADWVMCHFISDGVIDKATYDVRARRFVSITISVATEGITRIVWSENQPERVGEAVYADKCERITIPLE